MLLIFAFLVLPVAASIWPATFQRIHPADYVKPSGHADVKAEVKADPAAAAESGVQSAGTVAAAQMTSASSSSMPSGDHPVAPLAHASTYMQADSSWNPGQLSSSHQPWANDCKVCHSTPFARVQDKDCVACHKKMGDHVNRKTVTLSALHEVRCATCHRDHFGEFGLAQQNKRYVGSSCAACHADIKSGFAQTKTENVRDFASGHPDFRVQVATGFAPDMLARVRPLAQTNVPATMQTGLVESTSLKFPHDVHMATEGVRSPEGKVKMECASCHKPNAGGVGFQAVSMKNNCASCHSLKFEPAVSNREVPHGSVEHVLTTLREFYSYVSVSGVPLDRRPDNSPVFIIRPGKADAQQQPIASFVRAPGDAKFRAVASATELFEKTSCVVCHEVTRVPGPGVKGTPSQDMPQWKITPVTPRHAWMPKAEFDHGKHQAARCTDCHAAAKSHKARDVLMPRIAQCRECHAGQEPVVNKVTSDCGLCHGFHLPAASASSTLSKSLLSGPAQSGQLSMASGAVK